jgi:hypothetical protein
MGISWLSLKNPDFLFMISTPAGDVNTGGRERTGGWLDIVPGSRFKVESLPVPNAAGIALGTHISTWEQWKSRWRIRRAAPALRQL